MRVYTNVLLERGDGSLDQWWIKVSGEVQGVWGRSAPKVLPATIRLEAAFDAYSSEEVDLREVRDIYEERLRLERRYDRRFPNTIEEALAIEWCEMQPRTEPTAYRDELVESFGPAVRILKTKAGPTTYFRVSWQIDQWREPGVWTIGHYAETLETARELARKKVEEIGSHLRLVSHG